ncbi:MAG: DNA polymerase III subunit delta [Candidatus Dojkabacteria bacterium]|nr:DNA polymerase III subunit delta [Candidatus Dojkabacteria bacterium]
MQKLYHGNNQFLSLRAIHATLTDEYSKMEIVHIDAESNNASQIIDTIYSPSLFSTPRVYFIKRLYKNKEKDILLNNLFGILDSKPLELLIWEDQKIRSNTKYYKFFKEKNSLEEFNELNKRTFVTWAKNEVSNYPIRIDQGNLNTLSERSNYEPERFINNLNKLTLTGDSDITKDILDKVVADTLETDIWKLMDNINQSHQKAINTTLDKLLEYNVDPNYILAMIARNLRLSVQTKYLLDTGNTEKQIASILKLPPFAIYPIVKSVKNINKDRILLQYKKLSNLDYEIKTGRIDPILGLSLFTLVL